MSNKYCYSIVNKDSGSLLLEDHKLPFYWNKKVAQDICKNFGGKFCVQPVLIENIKWVAIHGTLEITSVK